MAHPPETISAVRRSYVIERLPLNAASEKHGVTHNTARSWKKRAKDAGDDWDKARVAHRQASSNLGDLTTQVLEDFAVMFQTTMTDIKDMEVDGLKKAEALSRLADAYTKTMKAAAGGEPKIAKLAVALEVLNELEKYIKTHHPDELEIFALMLEPFGQRLSEVFG